MSKPVHMANQRNMGKGLPVNLKMRREGAIRYNTFVRHKERLHMWKSWCRGRTNRHRLRERSSNQSLSWSQSHTQNLLHTVRNWRPYCSLKDWLQFIDAFLESVSTKPHIQAARASLCRRVGGGGGGGRSPKQWRHSGDNEPVTTTHLPDIPTCSNETNKSAWEKPHKDMMQGHRVSDGICTRSGLWQLCTSREDVRATESVQNFSTYLPSSTLAHETEGLRGCNSHPCWGWCTPCCSGFFAVPTSRVCSARSWFIPSQSLGLSPFGLSSLSSFSSYPNPRQSNLLLEQGPHQQWMIKGQVLFLNY